MFTEGFTWVAGGNKILQWAVRHCTHSKYGNKRLWYGDTSFTSCAFLVLSDSRGCNACTTWRPGTNCVSPVPADSDHQDGAHSGPDGLGHLCRTRRLWVKATFRSDNFCMSSFWWREWNLGGTIWNVTLQNKSTQNISCFTNYQTLTLFPLTGVFFAVASRSALIPVKTSSIAVRTATVSSTYTSDCETFLTVTEGEWLHAYLYSFNILTCSTTLQPFDTNHK